jgi:hypothetical protein
MSAWIDFQCEWLGLSPDSDDRTLTCGRQASGYVVSRTGRRFNVCGVHVGWGKSVAGSGRYVHLTVADDRTHPLTHHASAHQSRYNQAAVGTAY